MPRNFGPHERPQVSTKKQEIGVNQERGQEQWKMIDIMPNAIGVFISIVRQLPKISTKGNRKASVMNRTSKKDIE